MNVEELKNNGQFEEAEELQKEEDAIAILSELEQYGDEVELVDHNHQVR